MKSYRTLSIDKKAKDVLSDTCTVVFKGKIAKGRLGSHDTICLEQKDGFLIDLTCRMNEAATNYGSKVSVRYWITKTKMTRTQLEVALAHQVNGFIDLRFESHDFSYSEYTSDTSYNTDFSVGGHNLFEELQKKADKFLYMECIFVNEKQNR